MTNLAYDDEAELQAYNPLVPQIFCRDAFYTYSIVMLKLDIADRDIYRLPVEEQGRLSLIKHVSKDSKGYLSHTQGSGDRTDTVSLITSYLMSLLFAIVC